MTMAEEEIKKLLADSIEEDEDLDRLVQLILETARKPPEENVIHATFGI